VSCSGVLSSYRSCFNCNSSAVRMCATALQGIIAVQMLSGARRQALSSSMWLMIGS